MRGVILANGGCQNLLDYQSYLRLQLEPACEGFNRGRGSFLGFLERGVAHV